MAVLRGDLYFSEKCSQSRAPVHRLCIHEPCNLGCIRIPCSPTSVCGPTLNSDTTGHLRFSRRVPSDVLRAFCQRKEYLSVGISNKEVVSAQTIGYRYPCILLCWPWVMSQVPGSCSYQGVVVHLFVANDPGINPQLTLRRRLMSCSFRDKINKTYFTPLPVDIIPTPKLWPVYDLNGPNHSNSPGQSRHFILVYKDDTR